MMGCVLGTRSGRDDDIRRRRKSTERKEPRAQRNGEKIDRIRRVQSQLAASDRRKSVSLSESSPMRSIITVNQQGWPSWLVAVAGDAIKDWIPRRANTFEKLDKARLLLKSLSISTSILLFLLFRSYFSCEFLFFNCILSFSVFFLLVLNVTISIEEGRSSDFVMCMNVTLINSLSLFEAYNF